MKFPSLIMKTEWDFSDLESDSSELEIIEANIDSFVEKWHSKDFSNIEAPELLDALNDYEQILGEPGLGGKKGYKAYLQIFQNENNPEFKKEYGLMLDFEAKMSNKLNFFTLALARISEEKQNALLEAESLKDYKNFLKKKFMWSKHLLSENEEKIMTLKDSVAYDNWKKLLSSTLSKQEREVFTGEKKEIKNFSEIIELLSNGGKSIRDSAAEAFNDILEENADIAEAEINSILKDKMINDELRGFDRPDKSRHLEDNIETEIVDELIETVTNRFNIARRYYELKAKLFGVDKLDYHERNVPYGSIEKAMSYEEALNLVLEMFGEMNPEFERIVKNLINGGKIDVYPKKSKKGGAFCFHNTVSHPTYILFNYQKTLKSITTVAHEFGHAINNELMKGQNALNFGSPKSIAEIASTFFEDFVLEKLSEDLGNEEKLALLMQKINEDVSSVIRQIACYNFEKELHKKFREEGYLSKETIGKIFKENMEAYMGQGVDQSAGSENWWVYWSHIREYFYVYSYSSGLLISKYFQEKFRENKESLGEFISVLKKGTSTSPKEIFSELGVGLNKDLWNKGLDGIEKMLTEAEELAKKLGKI